MKKKELSQSEAELKQTLPIYVPNFPSTTAWDWYGERYLNCRSDKTIARVDLCNTIRKLIVEMSIESAVNAFGRRDCSLERLLGWVQAYMEDHVIGSVTPENTYWKIYSCDKVVKGPIINVIHIHCRYRYISEIELIASGLPMV